MLPSSWVASTKPEAALVRGQGWTPWQGRGWALAPRDRGPGAGKYCWEGHWLFVAAEIQAVRGQRLLDLFDRLLAEVRDRGQLVLALHDEVADRLDADALEAVVRADAELELLDREVLHPVRERRLGRRLRRGRLAEALDLLDVREDRELPDEDLRTLRDGLARV